VIVVEDTTEPFPALDCTVSVWAVDRLLDQLVVEPLVIAFEMVVLRIFLDGLAKVALAQRDDLGQTL
jgi:hypothetical protein